MAEAALRVELPRERREVVETLHGGGAPLGRVRRELAEVRSRGERLERLLDERGAAARALGVEPPREVDADAVASVDGAQPEVVGGDRTQLRDDERVAERRASHKDPQQTVVNGPLRLDVATRSTSYHGRTVHLSESEFRLCLALAERAGRPMTHDELIAIVWGSGDLPGGREMLKTSIWRLRLRLTQVNPVTVIESVRGTGYMMVKLSG